MSLLSPLGWVYGKVAAVRNSLYDNRTFESYALGARTISVGNITMGGTGKTPLVKLVAHILAAHGEKVCILTRGYGRRNESERVLVSDSISVLADVDAAGDEPLELAKSLLGKAVVVADADRVTAASWARDKFGVTAFVLDDGFQHRRARRDLDIVCIDAGNPFGDEELLPAGRLREPLTSLSRADAIVITRLETASDIATIEKRIREFNSRVPIFRCSTRLIGFVTAREGIETAWNYSESAFAFAGIGNPKSFFSMLRAENVNIAGSRAFRDHHHYTQDDIASLESEARNAGATAMVTSAKDAVKLSNLGFRLPCMAAMIDLDVGGIEEFEKLVTSSS
jgi:tetraacyldisaccharide 4'-kinase